MKFVLTALLLSASIPADASMLLRRVGTNVRQVGVFAKPAYSLWMGALFDPLSHIRADEPGLGRTVHNLRLISLEDPQQRYAMAPVVQVLAAGGFQPEEFIGLERDEKIFHLSSALRLASEHHQAEVAKLLKRANQLPQNDEAAARKLLRDLAIYQEHLRPYITDQQAVGVGGVDDVWQKLWRPARDLYSPSIDTSARRIATRLMGMAAGRAPIAWHDHLVERITLPKYSRTRRDKRQDGRAMDSQYNRQMKLPEGWSLLKPILGDSD